METNNAQEPRAPDVEEERTDIKEVLATNITRYRQKLGLSRAGLAKRIGVTEAAVGQWERSERMPSVETLCNLAKHFRIPVDSLIGDYDSDFWSCVKLMENLGFHIETKGEDVLILADTNAPPQFEDNEFRFEFNDGSENVLEYSWKTELVARFKDHYDFKKSVEVLCEIFCHALGFKYYANKFFLELMSKGVVSIPELILLERETVTRKYYTAKYLNLLTGKIEFTTK